MTKKSETYNEIIKPFIVLVCICVVVAVLLAVINGVTSPVIEQNSLKAAEEARIAVLPGATSFKQVDCDCEALGIESAYVDEGGSGYVVTAAEKGYGGIVTVTIGFDNEGKILNIMADVSTETTGVGSKAGSKDHLDQYIGLMLSAEEVDTISGATYSSSAVKTATGAALAAFDIIEEAAK